MARIAAEEATVVRFWVVRNVLVNAGEEQSQHRQKHQDAGFAQPQHELDDLPGTLPVRDRGFVRRAHRRALAPCCAAAIITFSCVASA